MSWNGIVAVDKPAGWTSRRVVDRIAKLVRPAKVGHAGTLDPLATGVLVVAVGSATRLISYVQKGQKRYVGRFQLGVQSDTDDIEGNVTVAGDWSQVTKLDLERVTSGFIGLTEQVPPQYSAVHVDGKRAHQLARQGATFELSARTVEIASIGVVQFQPPDFELDIVCGSGTYVRSIGRDIGSQLGCGCIMTSLRRLQVGRFLVDQAIPIESVDASTLPQFLLPPLSAVDGLERRVVTADEIVALRQGKAIPDTSNSENASEAECALIDQHKALIAMARRDHLNRCLRPILVLSPKDIL